MNDSKEPLIVMQVTCGNRDCNCAQTDVCTAHEPFICVKCGYGKINQWTMLKGAEEVRIIPNNK